VKAPPPWIGVYDRPEFKSVTVDPTARFSEERQAAGQPAGARLMLACRLSPKSPTNWKLRKAELKVSAHPSRVNAAVYLLCQPQESLRNRRAVFAVSAPAAKLHRGQPWTLLRPISGGRCQASAQRGVEQRHVSARRNATTLQRSAKQEQRPLLVKLINPSLPV
jgi:hypothetical protein